MAQVLSQFLRVKREFVLVSLLRISDILLWDILPKYKVLPEIQRPCDYDIPGGRCLSGREIPR